MAALNVDYIAWFITVLGAINSNLTFVFDLNYFLWKLKTSKRQGVSSLLETKHKIFQFKTKKIPRIMSVQDAKVASKFLSPTLNFQSHCSVLHKRRRSAFSPATRVSSAGYFWYTKAKKNYALVSHVSHVS